ncbi:hypothetical protein AKJ16_DCAP14566, partial [Drosera capensis]
MAMTQWRSRRSKMKHASSQVPINTQTSTQHLKKKGSEQKWPKVGEAQSQYRREKQHILEEYVYDYSPGV